MPAGAGRIGDGVPQVEGVVTLEVGLDKVPALA